MDSRDLEYVSAIARTGSFSQAARLLFISQPALSQYIRRLEARLGVPLFYRSRSRVELTAAGTFYVEKGNAILEKIRELEQSLQNWQQEAQKQLSIGVSQFYGKWFLTPFLENLQEQLPGYRIQIVDGESRFLETRILQRKLDFGLYPAPVTHKEVLFTPLGREEILFAFSEENREAMDRLSRALRPDGTVDLMAYRDFPFVLPKEGLKLHRTALQLCRHAGFQPKSVYQSENLDTVYSLINHNYGVGFLPDVLARNNDPRTNHVRFFSLRGRYRTRQIGLACLSGSPVQDLVPKIMAAIRKGKLQV